MISKVLTSKLFRLLVLLSICLCLAAGLYAWRWLHTPIQIPEQQQILDLSPGDSLSRVAYRLRGQIGLEYPRILVLYAKIAKSTNIKLGEYELPARVTPVELLQQLHEGRVKQRTLTLVEGTTFAEALTLIGHHQYLQATLTGEDVATVRDRLGITQSNPEGWLFPDTYVFNKHTTDWDLIQQSYRRMQDVLAEEWESRADNLPYESAYEALIMASIVEKETGAPHERAQIAGVFVRRLEKGMRLQTDPTVIYGMGSNYQGNIRRKHLREKTPYNTYTINGLPPTPIALPGREAIHAALHPADGDSLYFVAKGDGTHQFSATLAEHTKAVREYQLKRSSSYRSSVR
ncbi:endolytic transglycosylase MltG [Pseudomaricurvus sp.]|uniref:endolytic transglycosylase MltG n=1 Tax=Pseudomaricurvus sp. TaxID=2004510 RepID=UPI003F6B4507